MSMMFAPSSTPDLTPVSNALQQSLDRLLMTMQQQGANYNFLSEAKATFLQNLTQLTQDLCARTGWSPTAEHAQQYATLWMRDYVEKRRMMQSQMGGGGLLMMGGQQSGLPGGVTVSTAAPMAMPAAQGVASYRYDASGRQVPVDQFGRVIQTTTEPVAAAAAPSSGFVTPGSLSASQEAAPSTYNPPAGNIFLPPANEPVKEAAPAPSLASTFDKSATQLSLKEVFMNDEKPVMEVRPETAGMAMQIENFFPVTLFAGFRSSQRGTDFVHVGEGTVEHQDVEFKRMWNSENQLMSYLKHLPFFSKSSAAEKIALVDYSRAQVFQGFSYEMMANCLQKLEDLFGTKGDVMAVIDAIANNSAGIPSDTLAERALVRMNRLLGTYFRYDASTAIQLDDLKEINLLGDRNNEYLLKYIEHPKFRDRFKLVILETLREILHNISPNIEESSKTILLNPELPEDLYRVSKSELVVIDHHRATFDIPTDLPVEEAAPLIRTVNDQGAVMVTKNYLLVAQSEELLGLAKLAHAYRDNGDLTGLKPSEYMSEVLNKILVADLTSKVPVYRGVAISEDWTEIVPFVFGPDMNGDIHLF